MLDKPFVTLSKTRGGVPSGGTTGQILSKASTSNYDHTWSSVLALPETTFSGLGALVAGTGTLANISDSNTNVWGALVGGGGTNHVLVRYNGANWTVVGK